MYGLAHLASPALSWLSALWIGVAAVVCTLSAAGAQEVDLELVLAVDVSLSMDLEEQRLQRDGYVEAFRDGDVHRAILSGAHKKIAVTYFEWAGEDIQQVVLPWTVVDSPEAALAVAERLAAFPISRNRFTSISSALEYAERQLDQSPFRGTRRVIDVSGDGPNNHGAQVQRVRDEVLARGIVINGLPIMLKTSGGGYGSFFDIVDLDVYYEGCVTGGPGSFVIPIREKSEFATATRRKLILEIAGLMPAGGRPAILRAQHSAQTPNGVDCLIGERLWDLYMRGQFR
jgi:hypothetical protein